MKREILFILAPRLRIFLRSLNIKFGWQIEKIEPFSIINQRNLSDRSKISSAFKAYYQIKPGIQIDQKYQEDLDFFLFLQLLVALYKKEAHRKNNQKAESSQHPWGKTQHRQNSLLLMKVFPTPVGGKVTGRSNDRSLWPAFLSLLLALAAIFLVLVPGISPFFVLELIVSFLVMSTVFSILANPSRTSDNYNGRVNYNNGRVKSLQHLIRILYNMMQNFQSTEDDFCPQKIDKFWNEIPQKKELITFKDLAHKVNFNLTNFGCPNK